MSNENVKRVGDAQRNEIFKKSEIKSESIPYNRNECKVNQKGC